MFWGRLGFPELVFRLICVLSVFLSPTLSSRSPLVLLGDLIPLKIERFAEILVQATLSRSCSRLMSEKQLQMQVFSPENVFFSPSHTGSFSVKERTCKSLLRERDPADVFFCKVSSVWHTRSLGLLRKRDFADTCPFFLSTHTLSSTHILSSTHTLSSTFAEKRSCRLVLFSGTHTLSSTHSLSSTHTVSSTHTLSSVLLRKRDSADAGSFL